ncbi:MAG: M48 family metallopeptidase [bacterium]|nr:M48 family metallopeptidase [bacterium]
MTLYTAQAQNIRRTWLLMAAFLVLVIGIGWAFSIVLETREILYIAVALALVMNLISYWFADRIALAMHGAREASRGEAPELHRLVENLAITAGLPTPRLYIVDDPAPNAFATGRNANHAVVAVTTGLLERLDRTELEGVLAHELSHIGNRDMLVGTVAVVLAGVISILADFFLRALWFGGGRGREDRGQAQALFLIIGIAGAIIAPIAATLIRLAISRRREFLADASGALLTRHPEALARALQKISAAGVPMLSARTATAHLWLNDPFAQEGPEGRRRTSWIVKLFMTHPPVEERVAALRGV